MAIGVYFAPPAMSAAQYDECITLLRKAGAGNPSGRSVPRVVRLEGQAHGVRRLDITGGVR